MNRTILLRHLSNSSLAGQSAEFRQERIRLGRKSDNDVIFNPEQDRLVSGNHCEIVAQGDGLWVVDPGSTNGTFVNGQRINGRSQVSERDQIMLGETGPLLAVSFVTADTSEPGTVMGTVPDSAGPAPGLLDTDPDVGGSRATALTAPLTAKRWSLEAPPQQTPYPPVMQYPPPAPYVPPQPSYAGAPPPPPQATYVPPPQQAPYAPPFAPPAPAPYAPPPSSDRAPSRASLGQKTSIGFNTLMTELDKATKRERKRVVTLVAPIVIVLLIGGGSVAWYFIREANNKQTAIAPPPPPPPAPSTVPIKLTWSEILEPRSRSVYVVVKRKQGQADAGVGTAWSVAKGKLATNAHVAQAFADLGEGEYLAARSYADQPKDLKIAGMAQHPGYIEFNRLYKAHFPVDPRTGEQVLYATPYDVALLTIAEPDVLQQAPPLELADQATMTRLGEASDVAYVGYPMEQSVGNGVNLQSPKPLKFPGTLSRKTDPFMGNASDEKANIYQYQVPVTGGASGSPVFNHEGKVIGLVSGNDHAFLNTGVRIAIGGKAYGPRADAVRELLEGTADAKMAPMVPEWRTFLRARYNEAREAGVYMKRAQVIANNAVLLARPRAAPDGVGRLDMTPVSRTQVTVSAPGVAGVKELTFQVTEAGYYTVVAVTDNPDVTPLVGAPEMEGRLLNRTPNPVTRDQLEKLKENALGQGQPTAATLATRLDAGQRLTYSIGGASKDPAATATMQVLIYRATP